MGRYLTNKLIGRGFLSRRQARRSLPLIAPTCVGESYSVLSPLSRGYPPPGGRLPTCSSPFRHYHQIILANFLDPVRLACLIHAASVRSEPESNSQKKDSNAAPRPKPRGASRSVQIASTSFLSFRIPSGSVSFGSALELRMSQSKFFAPRAASSRFSARVETLADSHPPCQPPSGNIFGFSFRPPLQGPSGFAARGALKEP